MTEKEKKEFVHRCFRDVLDDICETQFDDLDNPVSPHTSEIIADYKSEAAEYEYMSDEEFDELYAECDRMSTLAAMAWA